MGLFFFLLFFLFFLPLSLLLFSLWTTHGDTHVDKAHAYTARAAGTFSLSSFLSLSRSLSLSLSLSLSYTHTHTHSDRQFGDDAAVAPHEHHALRPRRYLQRSPPLLRR